MKTLEQLAFMKVMENFESPCIGPRIQFLSPKLKAPLLEYILRRHRLTKQLWPYIVTKEFFQDLGQLTLFHDYYDYHYYLDDKFLNVVTVSGCSSKQLSIFVTRCMFTNQCMSAFLKNQDALETLRLLYGCHNDEERVMLYQIKSSDLKIVEIYGYGACPSFEDTRLYQSDIRVRNEQGLVTLFSSLGQKIVSVTRINEAVFPQLASLICQYCTKLKTLMLNFYPEDWHMDGSELLPLFRDKEKANELKHVQLGIHHISHELLCFMVDNCVNLKTLNLNYCETLDDALLKTLAMNCAGNLRKLNVQCCPNITDESILAIAINCATSLEAIYLLGTNVSDCGITALATHYIRLKVCVFDDMVIGDKVKEQLRKSLV